MTVFRRRAGRERNNPAQLVRVEKKVDCMIQTSDLDFRDQSTFHMNAYMVIEILKFLFGRKIQKSAKSQKT